MGNLVKVIISAGPNQGKTTIAAIIKEALISTGFLDVQIYDVVSEVPEDKKAPISQRIEDTKKRPVEIRVVTESIPTSPALCARCNEHPVAYKGAKYCGAGCSQSAEMKI